MKFDYIIVGAGTAGCVLANRLTENPQTTVLLLEAGKADNKAEIHIPLAFSKLFKTEYDWNYQTEPHAHLNGKSYYWPRGKTLGGSSSINAMIVIRGSRQVYDKWAQLGNTGWDFISMLPYFKKLEDHVLGASEYHGVGGPQRIENLRSPNPISHAFVMACQQYGIMPISDFNRATPEGASFLHVNQKNGMRFSAASAYLKPILTRPNLTIMTEAQVSKITFEGKRASGVTFWHDMGMKTFYAHREVLLCGGAINSPQLLLLSGVGQRQALSALGIPLVAEVEGVGLNLQDHLAIGTNFASRLPISLIRGESVTGLANFVTRRQGALTSNVAEAGAFLKTQPNLAYEDLQLLFAPTYFVDNGFTRPAGHGFTLGVINVMPHSTGYLRLRTSDPNTHPIIQPNYLTDERDWQVMLYGLTLTRKLAQMPAFDLYRGAETMPGIEVLDDSVAMRDYIAEWSQTLYHPVGTCKMAPAHDPLGVVDEQLRVRGVQGLRVVDASVFPIIPNGNTNTPTMALAERAADLIKQAI